MNIDETVKVLTDRTNELKSVQKKLLKELKEKHKEVYEWLQENNIDLNELGVYVKQIAAALVITISLISTPASLEKRMQLDAARHFTHIRERDFSYLPEIEKKAILTWQNYGNHIIDSSQKYDVEPELIFATIMVESVGNPKATRYEPSLGESSWGLGQLLYSTARWIGFEGTTKELVDPAVNIDLIARYHRRNLDAFGKLSAEELATAYNSGSPYRGAIYGHVDKFMNWYNKAENYMVT
ncbi:transglycosylase SLT domain-containing protein [Patescibacteria group bacterium]